MRSGLFILALLISMCANAERVVDKSAYRYGLAAELYQAEQYDSAAAVYQGLLDEGTEAFELYYNAGNAYFKAGDIGPAILNFERAKKLQPRNPDVQYNLELAYLRQPDREPDSIPLHIFAKMWRSITGVMSSGEWGISTIVLWWIALLGIGLFWFSLRQGIKKLGFYTFLITFVLGCCTLIFSFGKRAIENYDRFAIIMKTSAVIKSAPSHDATDLYILREGFKLRVTDEAGDWTKVMLTDGNTGWVEAEVLEEV